MFDLLLSMIAFGLLLSENGVLVYIQRNSNSSQIQTAISNKNRILGL